MNLKKSITILISILLLFPHFYCQFPEDFSSIDQLTYTPTTSEEEEVYINSYYKDSSSLNIINDYRNGIKLIPGDLGISDSATPCPIIPSSYTEDDDKPWSYDVNDNSIYYPSSYILGNSQCIANNEIIMDLSSLITDEETDIFYHSTYIFYFWIQKNSADNIIFLCEEDQDPSNSLIDPQTNPGLYQFYLRYDPSNGQFSTNAGSFSCPKKKIIIKNSNTIYFLRLKLTTLISKSTIVLRDCRENENKCPYSYYCDTSTGECKKCLGMFSQCSGRSDGISCSRFSIEWINVGTLQKNCKEDYYNLQNINDMSYDIIPAIRSNAASVSFWLFTTCDINESDITEQINPKIFHITLEDFFVVTIIPGKKKYTIYATGYEMYHEAYENILKNIELKQEFEEFIQNDFRYKNWYTKIEIEKINRWINIIVSYNKNLNRISIQAFYKKGDVRGGSLNIDENFKTKDDLPGEYIYNTTSNLKESNLHYKKYYRDTDITHLNIRIYNNDIGVYIRKLYVFITELLIPNTGGPSNSNNLFGFQYTEFEQVFKYFVEYYIYDMTKIYNNLNKKYLIIYPGDIEESLYTYSPGLYRLNLIFKKNEIFTDDLLIAKTSITCTDNINDYCYYNSGTKNLPYTCNNGYIEPEERICVTTSGAKILVAGRNAKNNHRGTLTDVCYGNKCKYSSLTEFTCDNDGIKVFDACLDSAEISSDFIGYFYYSYFFNLPPIKFNLKETYQSYYIQFNFLYETNSALRPKNKMRGKKLYLFYSDAFRIWHDYSMNYLGIEDKLGNSYKNLLPNFNTENENLFTIAVNKDETNNVYKGKIYINGVKIYMPPFTAGSLSYILFCHNDTACPVGKEVFWTSGFYNQIKIYNLEKTDATILLNDNSFYDLYIYNNYYSYYNYENGKERFNKYKCDEQIDMEIDGIKYNAISGKDISNIDINKDQLQMFNYGINQISILKERNYITSEFTEGEGCSNNLIKNCYGKSNIFSEEARVCKDAYYFKYDNCMEFPTSPKDAYFSLTLPLKTDISGTPTTQLDFNSDSDIQSLFTSDSPAGTRKVTYTFWLKLIGFKEEKKIFKFGDDSSISCALYYQEFNLLILQCGDNAGHDYYKNSYEIPQKNYGKYMHISIALSMHTFNGVKNFFISFQINNENIVINIAKDNLKEAPLLDIKKFSLFTEIFAQISKFYIYNEALIGGYAFNTNKYFDLVPIKIIDDSNKNCVKGNPVIECISDYDPVLNDDYYINAGYPNEKKVFLTKNNMYKIKPCSDKCGSSCYETGENNCACATNSYYDYILKANDNSYQCRKLPYLDFKRHKKIEFSFSNSIVKGIDFWYYATKGVNDYSGDKDLFKITFGTGTDTIIIKSQTIYENFCSDYFVSSCGNEVIEKWCHISCKTSINFIINSITFENLESDLSSPGIMLIRQLKLWEKDFPDDVIKKAIFNTEYKTRLDELDENKDDFLLLSIDSLEFEPYSKKLSVNINDGGEIDPKIFGYSPIEKEIPELDLCLETEDCKKIMNLRGIEDIEFENVFYSITGRYTIELWLKIKNLSKFLTGINIIWLKHMSISALTDTKENKLSLFCFPQDYLSSPYNKQGREIIDLFDEALNKERIKLDLNQYENEWIYIRCAYTWDNEKFYFKTDKVNIDGATKDVKHELASKGQSTDYPFKYLFISYAGVEYKAIIQNAKLNKESDIFIRSLNLYTEYLPNDYKSMNVLFYNENNYNPVRWLSLSIDFFQFEIDINNDIKQLTYLKKIDDDYNKAEKPINIIDAENCQSRGGILLYDIVYVNSDKIKFQTKDDEPLECAENYYLSDGSCEVRCKEGYNIAPGSVLVLDKTDSGICNYELGDYHNYQEPNDFNDKMICLYNYNIRVGFKCFDPTSQINSAIYFNRCYNPYPVYSQFSKINSKMKNGYIFEISFMVDSVNEFCDKVDGDRYLLWAHPHAIIQDKDNNFYYKDLNTDKYTILPLSRYEWNHVIFEYNPTDLLINIYINYDMLAPAISFSIEETNRNDYELSNLAFCQGKTEELCSLVKIPQINWGAAYYSRASIYNLKYSSVYMVYENIRNKYNYNSNSILVEYIFNTIGNDLNVFHDTYSQIDLNFMSNLALVSPIRSKDSTLLFGSSSNFDYGQIVPEIFVTGIEAKTGIYNSSHCYSGCKRCYDDKKNNCYQCNKDYELFNKQCRKITGYYYQLNNNQQLLEVQNVQDYLNNNPLTITLWIKYYGIIKDSSYYKEYPSLDCAMLIKFSTDDNIYLCHELNELEDNYLVMYKGNLPLFRDKAFLKELGTWQLISVSSYKCEFGIENTCNFYPSMFSLAINGQTAPRTSQYLIPDVGITLNKILFGYGIIMMIADINIYHNFILNPLGVVTNYQSYQNEQSNLIKTFKFYTNTDDGVDCILPQMILSYDDNRDIYYQRTGQCIKDYNIYHELEDHDCQSEDKMINKESLVKEEECIDCIPECEHCGGISKLNCSCYFNDKYWFRIDKDTNRLYCELVPYLDLNKYSSLEFSEIEYATTNEYAIEFWYFIYKYNREDIHFYDQTISWENHVKIEFTKYTKEFVKVECYPLNERDESIYDNDVTHKFYKWNHVICATDLNNKLYYLNERKVNNIIGEGIKHMDYSTYDDRRVHLKFESLNNMGDTSSNGLFLIKELRLWNFFSVREFNTKCIYNYDWSKNNDIPNILHYFPFKMDKKGLVQDIKGNTPTTAQEKNKIGYNVIEYEANDNEINIDEEFPECLIVYALPQRLYYNLTNVLIYNYEVESREYSNYKYYYYISEKGVKSYNDITKTELKVYERELFLNKFKESRYRNIQLNIYLELTEADSSDIYYGFTMIKINAYYPGLDLDYKTNGMQDNLEVNIDDLNSKYSFTEKEIWNRLYLYGSLGDIHTMALNNANTTTTFLNYYYDQKTLIYRADNIIIKNPTCNDNFCSGKGKCVIIVRNMVCYCYEGYTGSNCHITVENKQYVSETNLKMWNYLTNMNEFYTLTIDKKFLQQITYLVKSSTMFDDSYNALIQNFFNLVDYIKVNNFDLLMDEISLIFDTISFILINMYHDIQQFRAKNYFTKSNAKYDTDSKIPQVDLTFEQIDAIYDLSNKITTTIPELILLLIKKNKNYDMQNYTAFDFSFRGVSHSFNYLDYFQTTYANERERYNSYLPYIDPSKCADYIFGSTGYIKIFLVLLNYHYDPLAFHPQYSSSASYSLDAFFATEIGEKLDIKACPNLIDIYFPLTLYNQSEIEFINSHTKFLGENEENKYYSLDDPYVTWPVYVNKDGSINKKSRYDRINEVLPMINLECSYYNNKLGLASKITSTSVSDNFYLICQTHHLSFYTIQSQSSKFEYTKAGKFFYLDAPRVFLCGDNWGNGCSVLLIIIFVIFAGFITLFAFLEKTLMVTKSSLNNIKLEILKQNRLILDETELMEEITKVNKMNEQDNMERHLKITTDKDKVDKDLKQNLYLYGTKNIDYNEMAFKDGNKQPDLENNYGGKGVFSHPPKKRKSKSKSKSKKKDKHIMNTGFIIDDLYDINDAEEKEDDREKETDIKKSINYINQRNKKRKRKSKIKPKTQDNESENENQFKNLRFYHVKEYNPEKANQIDKFDYNMYKDSDFGFNESEGSEENKRNNNIRINSDNNSLKDSTEQLRSRKNKNEEKIKGEHDDNINNNMHDNDDVDSEGVENVDYFSKYKSVIKNENRKGGKKVHVQNGNYTIVDKYRKVTFVKEKIHYINLPDFFEQINKKDPNLLLFFFHLFLRRDIYISPFMVSSTINPRWKRILCLYMYILLQFLILTFAMTLGEDTSITKGGKVMLYQLINILLSDLIMLAFIPFFRISTVDKKTLFLNLKSTQQMQLLKTFKNVKETQKKKLKFIIGIMVATFILTFYFNFNYCTVLYDSRWTFAGCFLVGVVFDCFLYEGALNGAIVLLYYLKKKKKIFNTPYRLLFNLRNYRNCF